MKIKYVGAKLDGEDAFKDRTGITWMPGSSHEIADAQLAQRMLQHPDVFAVDAQVAQAPAPGPSPAPSPLQVAAQAPAAAADDSSTSAPAPAPAATMTLAPGATVAADPLTGMDDAQVRAFAKDNGLKIPGIGLMKATNLRAKVLAALAEKNAAAGAK